MMARWPDLLTLELVSVRQPSFQFWRFCNFRRVMGKHKCKLQILLLTHRFDVKYSLRNLSIVAQSVNRKNAQVKVCAIDWLHSICTAKFSMRMRHGPRCYYTIAIPMTLESSTQRTHFFQRISQYAVVKVSWLGLGPLAMHCSSRG